MPHPTTDRQSCLRASQKRLCRSDRLISIAPKERAEPVRYRAQALDFPTMSGLMRRACSPQPETMHVVTADPRPSGEAFPKLHNRSQDLFRTMVENQLAAVQASPIWVKEPFPACVILPAVVNLPLTKAAVLAWARICRFWLIWTVAPSLELRQFRSRDRAPHPSTMSERMISVAFHDHKPCPLHSIPMSILAHVDRAPSQLCPKSIVPFEQTSHRPQYVPIHGLDFT